MPHTREIVTFFDFLLAGLVLSFSLFFAEVLETHPHRHPCHGHLRPCLHDVRGRDAIGLLFRHFFGLSRTSSASPAPGVPPQRRTMGGSCFRMHPSRRVKVIPFTDSLYIE